MPIVRGTFEASPQAEPPFSTEDGVLLGKMTFHKVFEGALTGTSVVHMTYARTPVETSAGYVAIERIVGSLESRSGSFVVMHTGLAHEGELRLDVPVVPDSGTGELSGLTGSMLIDESDGQHSYTLTYELPAN